MKDKPINFMGWNSINTTVPRTVITITFISSRGAKSGGKPDRLRRTNAQIAEDSARFLDGQPVITSRFPMIKNTQLSRVDKDDLEAQKKTVAESHEVVPFSFL